MTEFPIELRPTTVERITAADGRTIEVAKSEPEFTLWKGPQEPNYGGKTLLDHDDAPKFAELVVLDIFRANGWDGVWADSFGRKFWRGLPSASTPVELKGLALGTYEKIRQQCAGNGGCWDVIAWKGEKICFVETKRRGKDKIRQTQIDWLCASLDCGLPASSFLIVEWGIGVKIHDEPGPKGMAIAARIAANGDLVIHGQDFGDLQREIWGRDEYEYGMSVAAGDLPEFLLVLLRDRFTGDSSAVGKLRELAKSNNIACEWWSR